MIKAGTYMARCVNWKLLNAKNTNSDYVFMTFVIEVGDHRGENVTWNGFFTDKAADRTFEALRACGWAGDDPADLSGVERNIVQIVTEVESYQGQDRARVKWVNAPDRVMPGEMSADKKLSFAQRMQAKAIASRSKMPPPGAHAAPTHSSELSHGSDGTPVEHEGDDEIPF